VFLSEQEWDPNQRYAHAFYYTLPAKGLLTNFKNLLGQTSHVNQETMKCSKSVWKISFESEKKDDNDEVIDYCKVKVEVLKKAGAEGEED
jgi:hypothetical protein